MIEQLMESFARHEDLAPEPAEVRRRIDAVATKRRRLRQGFVGGAAVAIVAVLAMAYLRLDVVSTAPQVGASAGASTAATRGAMTFLLVGTDRRPWEKELTGLLRSDAIMLAHLPADRSTPYLISIPRDVVVPDRSGGNTLNDVFAVHGIQGLRGAVHTLTGIPITGTVEVDFAGLIRVTDAVGGVDLCVPRRAVSEHTQRIFEPGCRRFSGEEAMDYLRQRRSFERGDFSRQQHVREYVQALYERLGDAGLPEILRLIQAGGDAVRVDPGGFQLAALFGALRGTKAGPVGIEPPVDFDGSNARLEPGAAQLWAAVRDGTLADWVTAHPEQVGQR